MPDGHHGKWVNYKVITCKCQRRSIVVKYMWDIEKHRANMFITKYIMFFLPDLIVQLTPEMVAKEKG